MKGRFAKSLQELRKDLAKYNHYCRNICKGDAPINNTTCTQCNQYKKGGTTKCS